VSRAVITAAEAVCALGENLESCLESWRLGRAGLTLQDGLLAGRIADRAPLKGRRHAAASNLALHVARRTVARAGWTPEQTREAWLFAASSRGNAAELLGENTWRRPNRRFSASNTLHSEIAAAVSIGLAIRGPWQMLANGCAAGLDALGMAWMAMRAGMTRRALVVAADLPLLPAAPRDFEDTRLLARDEINDPLSPLTNGFHPGEAAAALTLELGDGGLIVEDYRANSDAHDSLVVPEDGGPLAELLHGMGRPDFLCLHATGTPNHAVAEVSALRAAYGEKVPPLLLMKPFTGHTLGASGLLDAALLAGAIQADISPGNLPGLHCPGGLALADALRVPEGGGVLKIASGMGGHNAAVMLRRV